jgi:D-arabinose 1-dehydrogenase-like Zn-dependent alcohol dehydrogenase
MKAAVVERYGEPLVTKEVPDPTPGPQDAVIRVEVEGICRTDWHLWRGEWEWVGLKPALPIILGHEMTGVIEAVGSEVKRHKQGERVMVPVVEGCGYCESCLSGRSNLCWTPNLPGMTHDGGYGRLAKVLNADFNLIPLPDSVSFEAASAMGCRFPTAWRAVRDQGRLKAGEWMAVQGCGGVGLSAVMIGAALGGNVIAVDIDDEKLEFAKGLGAVATVNATREKVPEAIQSITKGGAHLSIDALGVATTQLNSVHSLRRGGRHVQVGLTTFEEKGNVPLPVDLFVLFEIEFIGSVVNPTAGYPPLLALVEQGRLHPEKLVTRQVPIEEAGSVLNSMTSFGTTGMVMINRW